MQEGEFSDKPVYVRSAYTGKQLATVHGAGRLFSKLEYPEDGDPYDDGPRRRGGGEDGSDGGGGGEGDDGEPKLVSSGT